MLDSYPDIMGKWKEEDFYSEKYLKVKSQIDQLLSSKVYKSKEIIARMKELLDCETVTTADILSEAALDSNSDMSKAFFQCLDKNDLTQGWTPVHKIKLYCSKEDEVVPYENSEAVKNAFGNQVEVRYCTGGHKGTCTKWYGQLLINNW